MRILIAGCGDVGSVLAASLQQGGHVVFGLKRDTSTLPEGVRPVQADLTRPDTLPQMPKNIDRMVFMPTPASRDKAGYEAIFIRGWLNLWASLHNEPARTLMVSSTAVYGESDGGIVDENTDPRPTGFNGKVLQKMEQVAAESTENLVVIRIAGIYGSGRERLLKIAVSDGLEIQQSPPYFTNRLHRADAAAVLAHLLFIDDPAVLYVATDDLPAPRYEVVAWLAREQGAEAPIAVVDKHAGKGKRVNNQRLRDSGFELSYPDYRSGYAAVLKARKQV